MYCNKSNMFTFKNITASFTVASKETSNMWEGLMYSCMAIDGKVVKFINKFPFCQKTCQLMRPSIMFWLDELLTKLTK